MRVSLVTGGGRGIGRAIALALAGPDTCVAVAGRTRGELDSTARDLERLGGQALAIEMDLTSEESVAAGMRELGRLPAQLDVLVNNAGVGGGEPVAGSDVARWRRVIDTNVTGTYLVTREAIGLMRDGGRIVNISSVLGRFGVPGYTAYCALCPGWVNTEMAAEGMRQGAAATGQTFDEFRDGALGAVPIKRTIQPEEVAELVRFVASPGAAAITGQTYNICGGQTMD